MTPAASPYERVSGSVNRLEVLERQASVEAKVQRRRRLDNHGLGNSLAAAFARKMGCLIGSRTLQRPALHGRLRKGAVARASSAQLARGVAWFDDASAFALSTRIAWTRTSAIISDTVGALHSADSQLQLMHVCGGERATKD